MPIGDQCRYNPLHDIDWHSEPNPCVGPHLGADLGVDPDQSALRIEQRPTGVARVDGCVGLDGLRNAEGCQRGDGASYGADGALGQGAFITKRVANGDCPLAYHHLVNVAHFHRPQLQALKINLDYSQIAVPVHCHHLRRHGEAIVQGDLHLVGALHHVGVGDDVSLVIPHKSRSFSLGNDFIFSEQLQPGQVGHVDHRRVHLAVHLSQDLGFDVQLAQRGGRRGRGRQGGCGGWWGCRGRRGQDFLFHFHDPGDLDLNRHLFHHHHSLDHQLLYHDYLLDLDDFWSHLCCYFLHFTRQFAGPGGEAATRQGQAQNYQSR